MDFCALGSVTVGPNVDSDLTREFCTRENVRETGTRGTGAWRGRNTVQSRSSRSCGSHARYHLVSLSDRLKTGHSAQNPVNECNRDVSPTIGIEGRPQPKTGHF